MGFFLVVFFFSPPSSPNPLNSKAVGTVVQWLNSGTELFQHSDKPCVCHLHARMCTHWRPSKRCQHKAQAREHWLILYVYKQLRGQVSKEPLTDGLKPVFFCFVFALFCFLCFCLPFGISCGGVLFFFFPFCH